MSFMLFEIKEEVTLKAISGRNRTRITNIVFGDYLSLFIILTEALIRQWATVLRDMYRKLNMLTLNSTKSKWSLVPVFDIKIERT